MSRWALLLCFLVVISGGVSARVLFEDDFNPADSDWVLTGANWKQESGALIHVAEQVAFGDAYIGQLEGWDDVEIEVDFKVVKFGDYGSVRFFFRLQKPWVGYGVDFSSTLLHIRNFKGAWDKFEVLHNQNYALKVGEKHTLKVVVVESQISVYLNGQLIKTVTDPSDEHIEGYFGIRGDNSWIEIYNVKVTQR